jgi:hypothetical protein
MRPAHRASRLVAPLRPAAALLAVGLALWLLAVPAAAETPSPSLEVEGVTPLRIEFESPGTRFLSISGEAEALQVRADGEPVAESCLADGLWHGVVESAEVEVVLAEGAVGAVLVRAYEQLSVAAERCPGEAPEGDAAGGDEEGHDGEGDGDEAGDREDADTTQDGRPDDGRDADADADADDDRGDGTTAGDDEDVADPENRGDAADGESEPANGDADADGRDDEDEADDGDPAAEAPDGAGDDGAAPDHDDEPAGADDEPAGVDDGPAGPDDGQAGADDGQAGEDGADAGADVGGSGDVGPDRPAPAVSPPSARDPAPAEQVTGRPPARAPASTAGPAPARDDARASTPRAPQQRRSPATPPSMARFPQVASQLGPGDVAGWDALAGVPAPDVAPAEDGPGGMLASEGLEVALLERADLPAPDVAPTEHPLATGPAARELLGLGDVGVIAAAQRSPATPSAPAQQAPVPVQLLFAATLVGFGLLRRGARPSS